MNDQVLRDFLHRQCRSKFMMQRPSLAHMVQVRSLEYVGKYVSV
jgi:hypothetical protein